MEKINLKHSNGSYDIYVGENIIENAGEYIENLGLANKKIKFCIVSDDIVFPLYGGIVKENIEQKGFIVKSFIFKHGENQKKLATISDIYDFLYENKFDRNDCLIALGGGIVGDITGFAAATYLRGIKFIQIPTTLLAQIDSSVGGKTGVNLSHGKNLAGAFYQPQMVLCDVNILRTLPDNIYADGMAEVIKHGCIKSCELFDSLINKNISVIDMVYQNIKIKSEVVMSDEFETGERAVLNFGHTIGHAIEKYYDFSKFSHGQSVALGMVYAVKISQVLNICKYDVVEKIIKILNIYNLPVDTGEKPDNKILTDICCGDKKSENDFIKFVLLEDIGKYKFVKINKNELGDLLCRI
ncbi:MAG: 3-dehydroquinate synthase [Oscillospiraceae bacterium]|nr:3-dehydroquinate synthase [Oscillospiraceae bacterium]